MKLFYKAGPHLHILPVLLFDYVAVVLCGVFIHFTSFVNGFPIQPPHYQQYRINPEIYENYRSTHPILGTSPGGVSNNPFLNTGTNVPVNNNNANPGDEPVSFKHPILYRQQATPIIERITVTNEIDSRNSYPIRPLPSATRVTALNYNTIQGSVPVVSSGPYFTNPNSFDSYSKSTYPNTFSPNRPVYDYPSPIGPGYPSRNLGYPNSYSLYPNNPNYNSAVSVYPSPPNSAEPSGYLLPQYPNPTGPSTPVQTVLTQTYPFFAAQGSAQSGSQYPPNYPQNQLPQPNPVSQQYGQRVQSQGTYSNNYQGGNMILQQNGPGHLPKVVPVIPLPSFRTIRNNPPGTTFISIKRPDGSLGYAIDPVPQPKPPTPTVSNNNYYYGSNLVGQYIPPQVQVPAPSVSQSQVPSQLSTLSMSTYPVNSPLYVSAPSTLTNSNISNLQINQGNYDYGLSGVSMQSQVPQTPLQTQLSSPLQLDTLPRGSQYFYQHPQPSKLYSTPTQQLPYQQNGGGGYMYNNGQRQIIQNGPIYPNSYAYQHKGYSREQSNQLRSQTNQSRSMTQIPSNIPSGSGQYLLQGSPKTPAGSVLNAQVQSQSYINGMGLHGNTPVMYNTQAVRQPQVNYPPPSYPHDLPIQDKAYSQQFSIFPQGARPQPQLQSSLPLERPGQPYRPPSVEEIQWIPPPQYQQQRRTSQSVPFSNISSIPYSQKSPAGFRPQAYAINEQDRSRITGQAYQTQTPQKYSSYWPQQQQSWYPPQERSDSRGYSFQGSQSQGVQSPNALQGGSTVWTPPRYPSPVDGWNIGGYQTRPNTYATTTTPGSLRAKLDQPGGSSKSSNLQQGEWQNGTSTFVGTGSYPYFNSIISSGGNNYPYAQPGINAKSYEVPNRSQQTVFQQNNNFQKVQQNEPAKNPEKGEVAFLPVSRGEVPVNTQPPAKNIYGRLPQDHETKEDNRPESDSAILQRYLQRAKQVLREQKSKQEIASRNDNPITIPAHSPTPTSTLLQQPAAATDQSSQPSPLSPGKPTSNSNPVSPNGPASFDATVSPQRNDTAITAPGTPGQASPGRDQNRADAIPSAIPTGFSPAAAETANVSPNRPDIPIILSTGELSTSNGNRPGQRPQPISKYGRRSRHIKNRRRYRASQKHDYETITEDKK